MIFKKDYNQGQENLNKKTGLALKIIKFNLELWSHTFSLKYN